MENIVSFDPTRANFVTQVASAEVASVTLVAISATFVSLQSGADPYGFAIAVDT